MSENTAINASTTALNQRANLVFASEPTASQYLPSAAAAATSALLLERPRRTALISAHYPLASVNPFAPYQGIMFMMMLRNVATSGYVFADAHMPIFSVPGCIIASPSYAGTAPSIDQDYVYHWIRDAAVVGLEMAQAPVPLNMPTFIQHYLDEFVTFSDACQANTGSDLDHASFNINATPRSNWGDQMDGPSLQTLAILAMYNQLSANAKTVAEKVVKLNLTFLLDNDSYRGATINLWEETYGFSFFTYACHLKCFQVVLATTAPTLSSILPAGRSPTDLDAAINWLSDQMRKHWSVGDGLYRSILQASGRGANLNADVVMAAVYGSVPDGITDSRLLSSAAAVRSYYENTSMFPVNANQENGPMIGRYPDDTYVGRNNPWLLCTANFAEFYYRVASEITANNKFALDPFTASFYKQVGITSPSTPINDVAAALRTSGDKMMSGILYHSDHFELSEQIDRASGYERSVLDLTWSYAAFLSAARARQLA